MSLFGENSPIFTPFGEVVRVRKNARVIFWGNEKSHQELREGHSLRGAAAEVPVNHILSNCNIREEVSKSCNGAGREKSRPFGIP
jgi:hypothetical protein